ncbi:MAG TPA: iron chelate uptake ABC transporter family permease subunit [Flavobacteriales bacterium]|nr:iron chelate uptake ABC transporter family permease subunit [Flavobacteriales bacterium]
MNSQQLIDFLLLREPNVLLVVAGSLILCGMAAAVGCFTFLRKRALIGDAISHSVLPGVCLAFILTGEKSPLYFLIGAILSGMLSLVIMEGLSRSRMVRTDTSIALMLSVFFGTGIVLLTSIQHGGNAAQAGLDKFLFGKAASITQEDIWLFSISAASILGILILFFRGFTAISFDEEYAVSLGFPVKWLRFCLSFITVWAVAVGIQAVGVVLMSALLITPALAARMWTHSLRIMIALALVFGMISGYIGAFVSYTAPAMPTGPWIVVIATLLAGISMLFAPQRGLIAQWIERSKNRNKTLEENILKLFYQIGEKAGEFRKPVLEEDLINYRAFSNQQLRKGLKLLLSKKLLTMNLHAWQLTEQGVLEAQRIVRLHRLWELYLQQYLNLDPDHVHDDAEAMEHVITPEIEAQLDELLGYPVIDPHNTLIPPRV